MPILANVRLDASEGWLDVSATDLEVSVVSSLEVTGKASGAPKRSSSTTVDARMLLDVARNAPTDHVRLVHAKGRLEVTSGESRFKLNTASSDEYPELAGFGKGAEVTVGANILCDAVERVAFAMSMDATRYNINGILFEPQGEKLRLVATDGHRLAVADVGVAANLDASVIVPGRAVPALLGVMHRGEGLATLSVSGGFLSVTVGDTKIAARLVDGQFPDYRQVLPKAPKTTLAVHREEIIAALRRMSLVTTDKNKAVKLTCLTEGVELQSSSPEYGEAREHLEFDVTGDPIAIGFAAGYLLDALRAFDAETVTMKFSGDLGPVLLEATGADHFSVVMPIRFD